MVTSVRIQGPFTGPSGYDHHVREFVRAFSARGLKLELVNMADWGPVQLPYNLRDPWFETMSEPLDARVTLNFCFPSQVVREPGRIGVNFTMFEADRIPAHWVEAHELSDLIVLPTEDSLRAWVASGVPEGKLRLCPLGVRADLFRPEVRPLRLETVEGRPLDSYGVRFLNVSELQARKNLVGLLRAWLRATKREDDAVLILKVGYHNPGSLADFEAEMEVAQREAGKRLEEAAAVHLMYDMLPDIDMPRLFAAATHYASLSFGEGWDLCMIEAAATGLSLIAPRHTGYRTYLNDDVATLIPATKSPAYDETGTWVSYLFEDANWWIPDEDEAVEAIRLAVSRRDRRVSARDAVATRFSWDAAAGRLIEILNEAEELAARQGIG